MAKIAAARPPATVRVVPRDDDVRRLVAHPHAGAFRAEGGATWPNDRFTTRRLAEGSITLEGEKHEGEKREGKDEEKPAVVAKSHKPA